MQLDSVPGVEEIYMLIDLHFRKTSHMYCLTTAMVFLGADRDATLDVLVNLSPEFQND